MSKISADKRPVSDAMQRRDAEQVERLFDLLPYEIYQRVRELPYAARVVIERWHRREVVRAVPFMSRQYGDIQYSTPELADLLDSLTADPPDMQKAASWLANHREEISVHSLAELVSAAMGRGVIELMSERADKRQEKNRRMKAEALRLWNEEYKDKEKMTKGKAAPLIAKAVGLAPGTVRKSLQGL